VGPVFEPGGGEQLASPAQQAQACGARETRPRSPRSSARITRSRACPCVVMMRSAVAEVVGPCAAQVVFALSRGERRRSLAFHFTVSSETPARASGKKEAMRVKGENARESWSASASKGGKARSRRLVLGESSCWHPRTRREVERPHVEKRHLAMEGVLVCSSWFSSRKPVDASLAQRPHVGNKLELKPTRHGGAKATGTSEVGSHRIAVDENSTVGWTDPPK